MKSKGQHRDLPSRPDVWIYRDARQFVHDICNWKKQNERGFSFRKIARFAEMASPGYIQTFIKGNRNLKPDTASNLAYALGLRDSEIDYFELLVMFTQADNPDEKTGYYEQLLRQSVKKGTGKVDAARLAYFTEWYIPVVHAMANLAGFRADANWIGKRLVPRIRAAEAQRALDTLVQLNLLKVMPDKDVKVLERVVSNDPMFQSILVREYHRAMIRLSERALDMLRGEDRSVSGFTVTVPRENLPQLKKWSEELLSEFFYKILSLQEGREDIDGEVVQCNLQTFRMTEMVR